MTTPSTIAHYKLTSKLGEGGMGAVYRATDTKLNRDVAIKVLPPAFAEDASRMQRFEREAQVLASLNHPNIAAIYGIEQGAIVMELVEGEDLKGPVPPDTALDYARQIAAGLEAAHEKGIVHRDLKPANIKVTPDGVVKLLDFGLAKTDPRADSGVTATMTQAGMIVGTAAYMSPEQARGKPVDKRADIWAFGVVLFELLTGKPLFAGDTVTDILAAVVTREPDWSALPEETPAHIRRLLQRCLRKDPKLRLRDIGEARLTLEEHGPSVAAPTLAAPRGGTLRARLPWTVAALALVAAAGAWLRPRATDPGPAALRFSIPYPPGTNRGRTPATAPAVPSPDGRYLAFMASDNESGRASLWVRPLGSTSAQRLDNTQDANFPFWSPDSLSIGFFADEKLKRVSVSGGSVQTLCDVPRVGSGIFVGDGGTWNREGVVVFGNTLAGSLMKVPAVGGVPAPVTAVGKDEQWHSWPQFLPDGRHLLYFAVGKEPQNSAIYVQELGSAKRVLVLKNATRGMWSTGFLLFVREGTLFAQHINARTFQLEGEPLAVEQEIFVNTSNGRSAFAVSPNGVLAYRNSSAASERQLIWRSRDGKVLGLVGQTGFYSSLSLSPDEKSVGLQVKSGGKVDTWVMDLASGVLTRMTRDENRLNRGEPAAPVWSPDSRRLAVNQPGVGIEEIAVASGKVTPLTGEPLRAAGWSRDGRSILCTSMNWDRLALFPMAAGAKPQTILDTPYQLLFPHFSPDEKYVVYESNESGLAEIYLSAFPTFAVKRKASTAGGERPVWAQGGREIFYHTPDGTLVSVEVRTTSTLEAGSPKPLFRLGAGNTNGNYLDVTADGQRFLIAEAVQSNQIEQSEISLVLNWAAEIKQH